MLDEVRRIAMVTSGVAELTKNRAEQIVRDLVKAGDVRRDQTSQMVKELVTRSAENRRELTNFVRSEIRAQVENLGVAGQRDIEKLERRIARLEDSAKARDKQPEPSGSAGTPPKKTTAGRSAAKKTTAKKTTAKKTTAKKTTAKKTTAKKLVAKKSAAAPKTQSTSEGTTGS